MKTAATLQALASETAFYPNLSDRVQSTFIDTVFMVILMLMFGTWLDRFEHAPDWIRIALFFGLWAVYEPLCTCLGGTMGNYFKGISVRRHSNVKLKINFFQAFLRYTVKMTLGWLSFFSIHSNKEKRAIHDLIVGSVMIMK